MPCSRTQRSDAGEARTRGPSVSSQALYHWATALPIAFLIFCKKKRKRKTLISVPVRQFLISTTYLSLGKNPPYLNWCLPSKLLIHFLILCCKRYELIKRLPFVTSRMHLSLLMAKAAVRSKAVVLLCWLFDYCYAHCGSIYCSMFCVTILYVCSSIAIILMGKRELIALLNLSSWCLVMVEWLFPTVPWDCLRFVIV